MSWIVCHASKGTLYFSLENLGTISDEVTAGSLLMKRARVPQDKKNTVKRFRAADVTDLTRNRGKDGGR